MIEIVRLDKAWNRTISRPGVAASVRAPNGMSEIGCTGNEFQYHLRFGKISETKVLGVQP
jgi:hypothetical protein